MTISADARIGAGANPGIEPVDDEAGLRDARAAVTPQRAAELLARWLGTDLPVPSDALVAALVHPGYQRRLSAARGYPDALAHLLENPPQLPPSAARMAGLDGDMPRQSTAQMLKSAGAAMVRWSATGFTGVDEETRARRWTACRACPNLVEAPRTGLHRLTAIGQPAQQICALCGCIAAAKVRLPTESCPDTDPGNPALTRWGDPLGSTEPVSRVRHEPAEAAGNKMKSRSHDERSIN